MKNIVPVVVSIWLILSACEDILDAWIPSRALRIGVGLGIFLIFGGFGYIKRKIR